MKMKDIYKIAISIPSQGITPVEAYDNHLINAFNLGKLQTRWKLKKRKPRYEFYWFTVGRLLTPMAREKLVEQALKDNVDYIIMYDDDMLLPSDMIEKMILDFEKHPEIDILAPLAFMRGQPNFPVIYITDKGWDNTLHQEYFVTRFVKDYPKDKLSECDAVGFGAVMIKMDIIRKMKPYYFFSTTGSGEDIYFCIKAKDEADARIFVDTRIKLGHLSSPLIIDEEYWEKFQKDKHLKEDLGKPAVYLSYKK